MRLDFGGQGAQMADTGGENGVRSWLRFFTPSMRPSRHRATPIDPTAAPGKTATQFMEFLGRIAQEDADDGEVRLSPANIQPIASDDVADAMAQVALGAPQNRMVEIAGPQKFAIPEIVGRLLKAMNDPRLVVVQPTTPYFGVVLEPGTLIPAAGARLGRISFEDWLTRSNQPKPANAASRPAMAAKH